MAPFSNRQYGREWFRKPFPNSSRHDERDKHDTLLACFHPTTQWTRLTYSKLGIRACVYQPNLVARKFSFSQLFPKSLIPKAEACFFSSDAHHEEWLEGCHKFCKSKEIILNSFKFSLSYNCTQVFEDWWDLHYESVPYPTLMVQYLDDAFFFMWDLKKKNKVILGRLVIECRKDSRYTRFNLP